MFTHASFMQAKHLTGFVMINCFPYSMPYIIVRSLLDMYTRQKVHTTLQFSHSEYFGVYHGIRKGGLLFPLLYTVYTDELMKRFEMSGLRCYITHIFAVALCYADDSSYVFC